MTNPEIVTYELKKILEALELHTKELSKKEWGADNMTILEAHAKKVERRNTAIQRRFDDEINY